VDTIRSEAFDFVNARWGRKYARVLQKGNWLHNGPIAVVRWPLYKFQDGFKCNNGGCTEKFTDKRKLSFKAFISNTCPGLQLQAQSAVHDIVHWTWHTRLRLIQQHPWYGDHLHCSTNQIFRLYHWTVICIRTSRTKFVISLMQGWQLVITERLYITSLYRVGWSGQYIKKFWMPGPKQGQNKRCLVHLDSVMVVDSDRKQRPCLHHVRYIRGQWSENRPLARHQLQNSCMLPFPKKTCCSSLDSDKRCSKAAEL
jgi:hypothetical protein